MITPLDITIYADLNLIDEEILMLLQDGRPHIFFSWNLNTQKIICKHQFILQF